MKKDMYEMEDNIMNVWRCVDDMKLLSESDMSAEELKSTLKGLRVITNLKCVDLWHSYENALQSNKTKGEAPVVKNPLSKLTTEQLRKIWDDAGTLYVNKQYGSNETMFEYCLNRMQDAILEQKNED
jgi:hypothetical protein